MSDYYRRVAETPDAWARGLSLINGGENLLRMALEFDGMAADADEQADVDAYTVLAAALRKHVAAPRIRAARSLPRRDGCGR